MIARSGFSVAQRNHPMPLITDPFLMTCSVRQSVRLRQHQDGVPARHRQPDGGGVHGHGLRRVEQRVKASP